MITGKEKEMIFFFLLFSWALLDSDGMSIVVLTIRMLIDFCKIKLSILLERKVGTSEIL